MSRSLGGTMRANRLPPAITLLVLVAGFFLYHWLSGLHVRILLILGALVLTVLLLLARWSFRAARRRNHAALFQDSAYTLSPHEFTDHVRVLLQDLGWHPVARVDDPRNQVIDLCGICNGTRYIIQCRRYKGVVNPAVVRELGTMLTHTRADRALLITTGHFSLPTREWAHSQQIELWDAEELAWRAQAADEAQQDPRAADRRKHDRRFVAGLVIMNSVILAIALLAPIDRLSTTYQDRAPALSNAAPTVFARALSTVEPSPTTIALTPSPTRIPPLTAEVFNGGNIRAQPDLQAEVLGQINAGETVQLLAKDQAGQWYRLSDPRNITGWVHVSLLAIDPPTASQVPIASP